ncbi:HNH endonuclease [Paenibacillus sp. YYML68]|uniref:HNH endonuclease n=1 Tax=Paenibacillus sp. YYML68 TaxID=2909250 RepID=UPI0024912D01|nr:HNH endonuclease [Paenibacillus sp. YYML68]
MRPIERGSTPNDANGLPIQFTKYQEARGHLIERIGAYCSYCERALGGDTAVEHIQPKSLVPGLTLSWDNFLLACVNCNSIKTNKQITLSNYFWPDNDNTAMAFEYSVGAIISPSQTLNAHQRQVAINTIKLTGLDRVPSLDPLINPEATDRRWRERRTAYDKAERAKTRLRDSDTIQMREQIVETATSTGFFSIWMNVFKDDVNMMTRFISAFVGTSISCYDTNCTLIPRPNGVI